MTAGSHAAEPTRIAELLLTAVDSRAPGLVTGLHLRGSLAWGEWWDGSDLDFTAVVSRRPEGEELAALAAAQGDLVAGRPVDGFFCTADDLARPPADAPDLPTWFAGAFHAAARHDVNPVSWAELAERPIVVRGGRPVVLDDREALRAFTRDNLASYWRDQASALAEAGPAAIGALDGAAEWCVLGVARLHHLLATGRPTSKSGAGRYVLSHLDERWHRLAAEALRVREAPATPTAYDDPVERGADVIAFVAWAVGDGSRTRG